MRNIIQYVAPSSGHGRTLSRAIKRLLGFIKNTGSSVSEVTEVEFRLLIAGGRLFQSTSLGRTSSAITAVRHIKNALIQKFLADHLLEELPID